MIQFFDRHELLDNEMLDYHAETMQMIDKIRYVKRDYPIADSENRRWKSLYKYMNAIYDGVLYPELTEKWYVDFSFKNGKEISLRVYAIIGRIYCYRPSSSPVTAHQKMMFKPKPTSYEEVDSPSDKIQVI